MPFVPDIPRIQDEVRVLVERFHLPGVGLGVVAGAEGFGWSNIAEQMAYSGAPGADPR